MAGFDDKSMTYTMPSVAIKAGHTIRKCCQILKGQIIETGDKGLAEDVRQFDELCEIEWSEEVSFRARKELYD